MKPTFIALLALCLSASGAGTFVGKVTSVTDGDTITVVTSDKKQFKIRLEGIDTPEGEQLFGDKATKALSAKVLDKQVTVTWSKPDFYGRLLANITVGSQWVNKEMVAEGWAWHYVQYSNNQQLAAAQAAARAARKGLWATKNPIAPEYGVSGRNLPPRRERRGCCVSCHYCPTRGGRMPAMNR